MQDLDELDDQIEMLKIEPEPEAESEHEDLDQLEGHIDASTF